MTFADPPATAAWRHVDSRTGFEVVYFRPVTGGWELAGGTAARQDGRTWLVEYTIEVDTAWLTRAARIRGRSVSGARTVVLETNGAGHWLVDGAAAPHLDGCLDVDLESSGMTNAMPVRRLGLPVGDEASAPAAWVRAEDLTVERLEQTYRCTGLNRYDYAAPVLGLERFEGSIDGHEGTCVFQRIGKQDQGSVTEHLEVVPGMGTGGLTDLRGEAEIVVAGHSENGYELVLTYDIG